MQCGTLVSSFDRSLIFTERSIASMRLALRGQYLLTLLFEFLSTDFNCKLLVERTDFGSWRSSPLCPVQADTAVYAVCEAHTDTHSAHHNVLARIMRYHDGTRSKNEACRLGSAEKRSENQYQIRNRQNSTCPQPKSSTSYWTTGRRGSLSHILWTPLLSICIVLCNRCF